VENEESKDKKTQSFTVFIKGREYLFNTKTLK
jgi:hypothetical protein